MFAISIIMFRQRKEGENTVALAIIFLTFQFNVDDPKVMAESRGKKLDTSLQSDNNWATNNLCKQLLIHLASPLTFPCSPTELRENYYISYPEVQHTL